MVYMAADNDLESYAIADVNEMESVQLSSSVNVSVLMDRTSGYSSDSGNWTDTRETVISYDGSSSTMTSFSSATSLGELDTGLGSSLTSFINWSVSTSPAENYALILWDHGGGLDGVCWDDTNHSELSLSEVSTAIGNSSIKSVDMLGFDACLMGLTEVYFQCADVADYIVASADLVPGEGWAYDTWLKSVSSDPTMTAAELGESAVTTYGDEYAREKDVVMALVETDKLSGLDSALDTFVSTALSASSSDWQKIRSVADDAYVYSSDTDDYDYGDLGEFMDDIASSGVSTSLKSAAVAVSAALDAAVLAIDGTIGAASGMSVYLPYGNDHMVSSYTDKNYQFLSKVGWDDFLAML